MGALKVPAPGMAKPIILAWSGVMMLTLTGFLPVGIVIPGGSLILIRLPGPCLATEL